MGPLSFLRTRRRPLLTAALLGTPLVLGGAIAFRLARPCPLVAGDSSQPPAMAARGPRPVIEPRAVLGRYWFDRLPENERDSVLTYLFFGGGLAVREEGSYWRSTTEYFDLERRGAVLDLTSLHDGKKSSPTFRIEHCDEKPPFDLCLLLEGGEGPRKLYGFSYGEDLARALPKGGAGSNRFTRASRETPR